jgi:TatA/E family protein of Tat protein translocase
VENMVSLAIFGMGTTELIIVLVIILVLFGSTKLPALARGLGSSVSEFKKGVKEGDVEAAAAAKAAAEKNPAQAAQSTAVPPPAEKK